MDQRDKWHNYYRLYENKRDTESEAVLEVHFFCAYIIFWFWSWTLLCKQEVDIVDCNHDLLLIWNKTT